MSSHIQQQSAFPIEPKKFQINLRIQTKLIIGNLVIITLLAIIGVLSWQILNNTIASLNHITEDHLQSTIHLANAQNALWQLRYGVSQYITTDQAGRNKINKQTPGWYKQIDTDLSHYVATDLTDEEKIAYQVWQEFYAKYSSARPRWFALQDEGKVEEAAEWRAQTIFPDGQKAVNALELLIKLQRKAADAEIDRTKATLTSTFLVLIGIIIATLVWSTFQAFYFMQAIGRPIKALTAGAQALSAGQLDTVVNIPSADEFRLLGNTFNHMASTVKQQTSRLECQVENAERARAVAEHAQAEIAAQLSTIDQQQQVIREMSVPILPLSNDVLIMPLIGALDSARIQIIQQMVLTTAADLGVKHVIIDITGVPVIDTQVGLAFIHLIQGVRLLGAEVVITGIRPEVAQTMVGLNINLGKVQSYSTLQNGLHAVM